MKQQFIAILIFFFTISGYSQSYKKINRAEDEINAGNYDKALRLLENAENQNYGFCGNVRIEAENKINELKLRLYKEKGNKAELKKFLNSIDPIFEFDNKYSKERVLLALETFSKEDMNSYILEKLRHYLETPEDFGTDIISL